ncbi:MAG: DUF2520 domain-containing protein [Gammaproteobacteria bacterium]|nr:DUF2520 domain-containing protein [Gammaproteobacteria bacterium]
MKQVPHYLIIGNGRVAKHIAHYFTLLKITFAKWCRKDPTDQLITLLPQASHILILIDDRAIDKFIAQHLQKANSILVHFSGSLTSKFAYGAHPLTSFNDGLYDLETYMSIPFIIDHDAPDFGNLLPNLSNLNLRLNTSLKSKYHALCVLSGNFSVILWQKFFRNLSDEFNIPISLSQIYLTQITQNLIANPENALTGPLVRHDYETINNNLASLKDDPFQEVYQTFVTCYDKITMKEAI